MNGFGEELWEGKSPTLTEDQIQSGLKHSRCCDKNINHITLGYTDTVHEYLCLPHEPKFKDIDMSATLDAFISSVKAHIVGFVCLEKVLSPQLITLL